MKFIILFGILFLSGQGQPPVPKNDPNGTWQSESGTQYTLRLSGKDLRIQLVEGSNPRYLKYEVNLTNQEEANSYKGAGYFLTKFANGKECKFDTEWTLYVVTPDRILGATSNIIPDPETCAVKEKNQVQLDLKKK